MKKILLFISVVLVSLAFVVFLKTTGLKSKQLSVRPALGITIDTKRAAEKLAKAIQFKTISNQEPSQFDYPQFIDLHALLAELFPNVHRKLKKELVNEYSLLYSPNPKPLDGSPYDVDIISAPYGEYGREFLFRKNAQAVAQKYQIVHKVR